MSLVWIHHFFANQLANVDVPHLYQIALVVTIRPSSIPATTKGLLLAPILQSIATPYVHAPIVSIVVFFKISIVDVIQIPNMHPVAPKVTPVALVTIGFLSSNPLTNGSTLVFATISITIQVAKVVVFSLAVPSTLVSSSL